MVDSSPASTPCHIHDPSVRIAVSQMSGWTIRVFPHNTTLHRDLVTTGTLHLQIHHQASGTSILTPSKMFDLRFVVWDGSHCHATRCWRRVLSLLPEDVVPPCRTWVSEHETVWIHLHQLGCVPRRELRINPPPARLR